MLIWTWYISNNSLAIDGDCEDMEEGNHEYPFSFQLPEHLPPSFDGKYGKIRYVIKAFVYGPGDSDYSAKLPIVVKTVVDLNNVELAKVHTT